MARLRLCLLALALSALATLAPTSAGATSGAYLATGDSIAFGTNIALDPSSAANFVGYPSPVADVTGLALTNSSCPGETSGHFVSLAGTDLVCGQYRALFPLHTAYTTSQLDFTVQFLRAHRDTQVVSIDIGANDLFLLELRCVTGRATFTLADLLTIGTSISGTPSPAVQQCLLDGLGPTLGAVGDNLDRIFGTWRAAGFLGRIVALTVYSTDYANVQATAIVAALDQVIAAHTVKFGGRVADGFGAFKIGAAGSGGDACAAGLLNPLPPQLGTGCDVHPSVRGRNMLAGAVLRAL